MLRAMAKLNGDDQKTRDIGNRFSQKNTTKQLARAKEAKAMGLTPLAPQEQHELQKKLAAGYTSISERAVNVPRVGVRARPQRPAAIDLAPRRRLEAEIRAENDNFETPQALPGVPTRSSDDKKDELALRNQFYGKTPQEVLAQAPQQPSPPPPPTLTLREQIETEVAERHDFMDQMSAVGRLDRNTAARMQGEIAERLQDLERLEKLGGEGD